jgi:hypothetical protein
MKYPFKTMPVGRCYFVKPAERKAVQAAYKIGRRLGMVFSSKTIKHTADFSLICIRMIA